MADSSGEGYVDDYEISVKVQEFREAVAERAAQCRRASAFATPTESVLEEERSDAAEVILHRPESENGPVVDEESAFSPHSTHSLYLSGAEAEGRMKKFSLKDESSTREAWSSDANRLQGGDNSFTRTENVNESTTLSGSELSSSASPNWNTNSSDSLADDETIQVVVSSPSRAACPACGISKLDVKSVARSFKEQGKQIREFKTQMKDVVRQNEKYANTIRALKKKQSGKEIELQNIVDMQQGQLASQSKKIEVLYAEANEREQKAHKMTVDFAAFKKRFEAVSSENKKLQEKLANESRRHVVVSRRQQVQEEEYADIQKKLARVSHQMESANAENAMLRANCKHISEDLYEVKVERNEALERTTKVQEELAAKNELLDEYLKRMQDLERTVEVVRSDFEQESRSQQETIEALRLQVSTLTSELEEARCDESNAAMTRVEGARRVEEMDAIEEEMKNIKSTLEKKDASLRELKEELRTALLRQFDDSVVIGSLRANLARFQASTPNTSVMLGGKVPSQQNDVAAAPS